MITESKSSCIVSNAKTVFQNRFPKNMCLIVNAQKSGYDTTKVETQLKGFGKPRNRTRNHCN